MFIDINLKTEVESDAERLLPEYSVTWNKSWAKMTQVKVRLAT